MTNPHINPALYLELPTDEAERLAWINGDDVIAKMLCKINELEQKIEDLEDRPTLEQRENMNGSAENYHQFFYYWFEWLNLHCPCPSVTNDKDCAVIFEAIERGQSV